MKKMLIDILNNITLSSFPHSNLLLGEMGCGKHFFISQIADKLCIEQEDITDKLSKDVIDDIFIDVIPKIYIINIDNIVTTKQNTLLKIIEEPPTNAYFALISTNLSLILPTIVSRCNLISFPKYSDDELLEFTSNAELLKFARTPGQIKDLENQDLNKLILLCKNIYLAIENANIVNLLSVADKIDFKNINGDKYYFGVFIRVLNSICIDLYRNKQIPDEAYFRTRTLISDVLSCPNGDHKRLFELFLLDLKVIIKAWKLNN